MKFLGALLLILFFAGYAQAQTSVGESKTVQTTTGQAVAGAQITVCTYSSTSYNSSGQYNGAIPCAFPLTTYYDPGLMFTQSPVLSNGQGNYFYYVASASPNTYTVTVSAPGRITPYGYSIVLGGGTGGGGGSGTVQPGSFQSVNDYPLAGINNTTGPTNCFISGANLNNFGCAALGEMPGITGILNTTGCTEAGAGNFNFDIADATYGVPLFGSGTNPTCVPFAMSVIPGDSMQFVSSQGNDNNNGLSWGTAKLTVMAAYDALPTAGGTIEICAAGGAYVNATATSGQGIWLAGSTDPNYSSLPTGWRQAKPVSFVGECGNDSSQQGAQPVVAVGAGGATYPGIWLSSVNLSIHFENLLIQYPVIDVQLGVDSNGAQTVNSGVYGASFKNMVTNDCNSCSGSAGPGWNIGGGDTQDIFLDHIVAQGNPNATVGSDNQAAILIKPTSATLSSAGAVITNSIVEQGPIKIYSGSNGANSVVRDTYSEGIAGGSSGLGTVWLTNPVGPSYIAIQNVFTADQSGTVYDVQVDGALSIEGTVSLIGYFPDGVKGPATINNIIPTALTDPLVQNEQGFFNGKVIGWSGQVNRSFASSAVRYANLASTAESGWTFFGSGNTITTGITAPDGTTGATQLATTSPTLNQVRYYDASIALSVGDYLIGGVWEKSTTGSVLADYQAVNLVSVLTAGDTVSCQRLLPAYVNNEAWMWVYQICQVTAVATSPGEVVLENYFNSGLTVQTYAPIIIHIPTGIAQDEAYEIANNLTSYNNSCSVGTVCGVVTGSATGTVTSVATTSPIGGGTIVGAGTITCTTCTTNASALTANQPMVGAGLQASAALATSFTPLTTTCAGAQTWAINSAWISNKSITITGSCTLNLTAPLAGGNYVLVVTQGSGGSHTLALGTGCTWKVSNGGGGAITPTTTATAVDVLTFTYDGTNCYANYDKNFN